MTDRGTYEDLKAQVGALANAIAEQQLLVRALGVAVSQVIARVDKLEDQP